MRLKRYIVETEIWELSRKQIARKFNVPEDAIETLERFSQGIRPARGSGKWYKAHGSEIEELISLGLVDRQEDPQKVASSLKILTVKGKKIYQARSRYYNSNLTKLIDDENADIPNDVLKDFPDLKKTAKNLR